MAEKAEYSDSGSGGEESVSLMRLRESGTSESSERCYNANYQ